MRENIGEIFESGLKVVDASIRKTPSSRNFRSIDLQITVKNGKGSPEEIRYTFDVTYYRGFIKKLAKPGETDTFFDLANVKLMAVKRPTDKSASRFKEAGRKDVRILKLGESE